MQFKSSHFIVSSNTDNVKGGGGVFRHLNVDIVISYPTFKLEASPGLDLLENCRVYPGYTPGKVVDIALAPVAFHWKST